MSIVGRICVARPSRAIAVFVSVTLLLFGMQLSFAGDADAVATAVPLGRADSFAVLAGAGITNTGPTTVNGDIGTHPTTTTTDGGALTVSGTIHGGDSVTQGAKTDLITAYDNAAGQGPAVTIVGNLGGQTLTPNVYSSASSIGLTGEVILNGEGNANAVFVFKAGSELTTASSSRVTLINGTQACNVFWQITSDATLGTDSTFRGTLIALSSITVTTRVVVTGRVLARNGTVTLDSNTITKPTCSTPPTTTTTTTSTTVTPTTTTAPTTTTTTEPPAPPPTTNPEAANIEAARVAAVKAAEAAKAAADKAEAAKAAADKAEAAKAAADKAEAAKAAADKAAAAKVAATKAADAANVEGARVAAVTAAEAARVAAADAAADAAAAQALADKAAAVKLEAARAAEAAANVEAARVAAVKAAEAANLAALNAAAARLAAAKAAAAARLAAAKVAAANERRLAGRTKAKQFGHARGARRHVGLAG